MDKPFTPRHILEQIMLMLLLLLLTLNGAVAQEQQKKKELKKVHVQVMHAVDGKTQVVDTLLQVTEHGSVPRNIRGVQLDSLRLPLLREGRFYRAKADSLGKRDVRKFVYMTTPGGNDTALYRRVRVFRNDSIFTAEGAAALAGSVKLHLKDTLFVRNLKGAVKFHAAHADTIRKMMRHLVEVTAKGDTIHIVDGHPRLILSIKSDSLPVLRLKGAAAGIDSLHPIGLERLIVNRHGDVLRMDSTVLRLSGSPLKIIVSEEKRFGSEGMHELSIIGDGGKITVIDLRDGFTDLTSEDKSNLQENGKAVETGAKNELRVEEITFYPNPNNGRFTLCFSLNNKNAATVRVMDSTGKEIYKEHLKEKSGEYQHQVDISKYGRGVYSLQVAQGKKYLTKKVIVQ